MKLSTGLLFVSLTAGSALAQIPSVVQHVQDQMNGIQQQKKAAGDAALNGNAAAKVPAGKPAAATAAKPTAAPASAKPATTVAQKSPVNPAAPKPPLATAKPADGPAAAKAAPATQAAPNTKAAPNAKATATVPVKHDPFAKTIASKTVAQKTTAPKTSLKPAPPAAAVAEKQDAKKLDTKTAAIKPAEPASPEAPAESKEEAADKKKESGFITAGSRRDPFVSPIVQHMAGTGCSTGKRCLAIDQIALRGIVKSDGGMIAVVVNSLDKAYFLRENDPVFNGYVLKISGDSVVFKETVQDKLGHLSTREVVKKITTPAV